MFDATYFRNGLAAHAAATGNESTVDLHLVNGHGHRVRSVLEVTDGYVVLEVYQRRPEMTGARLHWQGSSGASTTPNEIHHAVITYESIAQVVVTPPEDKASSRIGFNAPR